MNSNNKVACPLDCYDACQGQMIENNIKGSKEHKTTNGKLCVNFANLLKEKNLEKAIYEGKEISLDEVKQTIESHDHIITVHDLHIWTITSGLHALSCHVVVDGDMRILQASELIHELEHSLEELGINHTTIQVESIEHPHNRLDAIVCSLEEADSMAGGHSHLGHSHH